MELINYTEVLVKNKLNELWQKQEDYGCRCKKCKLDIIALALNNLPPRYVVSDRGELFSKINSFDAQISTDITSAVVEAMNKVSRAPNH